MARDLSLNVTAANLNGGLAAVVDDRAFALNKLDFRANVTQDLAATFIDMVGAGLASKPTLAGPAAMTLTATPFTIPIVSGKPILPGRAAMHRSRWALRGARSSTTWC
jgi:hypothetical protein